MVWTAGPTERPVCRYDVFSFCFSFPLFRPCREVLVTAMRFHVELKKSSLTQVQYKSSEWEEWTWGASGYPWKGHFFPDLLQPQPALFIHNICSLVGLLTFLHSYIKCKYKKLKISLKNWPEICNPIRDWVPARQSQLREWSSPSSTGLPHLPTSPF